MYYIILEKNIEFDVIYVHSVYQDEALAVTALNDLIEGSDEDYGYRMDVVGSK